LLIADHVVGLPVLRALPLVYMLSPIPRRGDWVPRLLASPAVSAFPDSGSGSAHASSFSRLARRSLALRPAHARRHRISWQLHRRLQPFRYLHSCPGCIRLEQLPGGTFTHWKAPPCHGAPQERTLSAAKIRPRLMQSACRMRRAAGFLEGVNGLCTARASCPARSIESATEGRLRSFQLTNQAIDSYQNSESEMHSHW